MVEVGVVSGEGERRRRIGGWYVGAEGRHASEDYLIR